MVCVGLNFGLVLAFSNHTGKEYQLTERLQPLNKRKDFTVFSGLDHGTEAQVDTAECMPIYQVLSKHSRNMPEANISVDQKGAAW